MSTGQSDPNQTRLQAVDSKTLSPIVAKALNQQAVTLTNWNYQQVHGGFGGGIGGSFIYRFTGDAMVQDDLIQWSLILKIIHARPDEPPDSTHYWKREFEAYRSGLLENLPGGVVAARCFHAVEYPDESCWIWQEDIQDDIGDSWQLEHYQHIARHFGQFNGAYLTTPRSIPDEPWFGTGWLRHIAKAAEPMLPQIEAVLQHPMRQSTFPADADKQFLRLWDERERFLSALDKLPQSFAHQDPVRRNLFLRLKPDGEYETVAIDWAYVGQAAVGMEIAVHFIISLTFNEIPIIIAQEFDTLLYENYLEGLRNAGWKGDARQARLGFTAAASCKYFENLMFAASNDWINDPVLQAQWEKEFGQSVQAVLEQAGGILRYVFQLADEARQLMEELNYP
jgi:hypothetical protein